MSLLRRVLFGGFPIGLVVALALNGYGTLTVPRVSVERPVRSVPAEPVPWPDCLPVTIPAPTIALDPALLASGDEVKVVQEALGVTADGVYGPQTARAVPAELVAVACQPEWQPVVSNLHAALQALSDATPALLAAAQARQATKPHVAAPVAPVVSRTQSCADLAPIVYAIFTTNPEKAMQVAARESGCTDTARNPSGASGIFQIMMPMHAAFVEGVCGPGADRIWDPVCNTMTAWEMSNHGTNWGPWSASGG